MSDRGPTPSGMPAERVYVPGFRLLKLLLALFGLALIALSFTKFGTVLRLAYAGESARAESARVVLVDSGGLETVLTQQVDVIDAEKRFTSNKDRSTSFWIEYRFTTADGREVEARSPIGCTLKPLHPYRDADGLPATIRIWYDPADPKIIVLPFQFLPGAWFNSQVPYPFGFGTFFIPGMLLLSGCAGLFVGILLWWHANKPIELPDLSQAHGEADDKH